MLIIEKSMFKKSRRHEDIERFDDFFFFGNKKESQY